MGKPDYAQSTSASETDWTVLFLVQFRQSRKYVSDF